MKDLTVAETEMVRLLEMVHVGQQTVLQKEDVILHLEEAARQKDEVIAGEIYRKIERWRQVLCLYLV